MWRGWIRVVAGIVLGVLCTSSPTSAQSQAAAAPAKPSSIYVMPGDGDFHTYVIAALIKKKVPANIVDKPELATLTLKAAVVEEHSETTGSKVVKCLFAYCADTSDKANTSVQLVNESGVVVWSYAVNKARGNKNRQSMAEAIASHLKSEYFGQ
jgi:hypothetical protein